MNLFSIGFEPFNGTIWMVVRSQTAGIVLSFCLPDYYSLTLGRVRPALECSSMCYSEEGVTFSDLRQARCYLFKARQGDTPPPGHQGSGETGDTPPAGLPLTIPEEGEGERSHSCHNAIRSPGSSSRSARWGRCCPLPSPMKPLVASGEVWKVKGVENRRTRRTRTKLFLG